MTQTIDPNAPAFPVPGMPPVWTGDPRDGVCGPTDPQPGMSIRATMAMHMGSAILASCGNVEYLEAFKVTAERRGVTTARLAAMLALEHTDALIAELNRTTP